MLGLYSRYGGYETCKIAAPSLVTESHTENNKFDVTHSV